MTRNEPASYWADTALSYFETMARQQEQTSTTRKLHLHRSKLPLLTAFPEFIASIAACGPRGEDNIKPSPVTLPPAEGFSPD